MKTLVGSAMSTDPSLRPVPTCCACVLHRDRVLLIQRGREPSKGLWSFPGGRIELGETIFGAVKREVMEETGVEIEPQWISHVYDHIVHDDAGHVRFHYVVNYVWSSYLSGEPRAGSDARQVCWATEADIAVLPMHPFARRTALCLVRKAVPWPVGGSGAYAVPIGPTSE